MERPTGITILAVLSAIAGVFTLLGGLALFGLGGIGFGSAGLAGFVTISGVVLLIVGIAYLALAYGFWTLKSWAWMLGVGLAVFSIAWTLLTAVLSGDIVSGITGGIVSIVISAVILWYLIQPNIKSAFGRS